jgi:uncharacterized protein involved in exopolysaccharide biosynthesis
MTKFERGSLLAEDDDFDDDEDAPGFGEAFAALRARWVFLALGTLVAGLLGAAGSYLIKPTFTAKTTFMPPQQGQSGAAAALSSLGSLASLVGGSPVRSPGEQYVALMQSVTVSDRLIDDFKLMQVYDREYKIDARKDLAKNVRIALGKKDGLISVEVDDESPQRAAEMANRYVDELRHLTSRLAISEAQQRRVFFERQLQQSRDRLVQAQQSLQASGFNPGALKVEPKAAAEGYARLKAEVTAAEVKLQVTRSALADSTPEVRQQQSTLAALRDQLSRLEQVSDNTGAPDYIGRYRDFKYQETLFELYARQFELARVDESREGALIQVVDPATNPERKSHPRRSLVALGSAAAGGLALVAWVLMRRPRQTPLEAEPTINLSQAVGD